MNIHSSHEQQLMREISMLEGRGGDAVQVEQYKRLVKELGNMRELKSGPPPRTRDDLLKAIAQTGSAPGWDPATMSSRPTANVFGETIDWHKAAIKVFEYMSAQMAMDLFVDDPKAKKIFEKIINAGYEALHNEATNR